VVQSALLPQFTEATVVMGLSSPTAMQIAPDGRIFICQQGGKLRVVKNGALLPTEFVNLTVDSSGERGLLGVAFDPAFASNHFVYVYYTVPSPLHNRVSRFTANGDVAVPGSETVLLDIDGLSSATNHNGGALNFGPDGKLYIAVGENANGANAQSFTTLKGKILRINSNGSIPSDNPFLSQTTGKNQAMWAMGLRNPFTFSFQPGTTRMFINDVGQNSWEEIDDGMAGKNYGWPTFEGDAGDAMKTKPFYTYATKVNNTCAIVGSAFYNPTSATFPSTYIGKYFFGDYCAGWIRTIDPSSKAVGPDFVSGLGVNNLVDIKVASDGTLLYLGRSGGKLMRVSYTGSNAPAITQQPQPQTVPAGGTATFTVAASGSAPLNYQWQRGTTNISGATSATYALANVTTSDNGATFRCVVTNSVGSATSNSATLTVLNNDPPVATITAPAAGTLYVGNQTINYAGTGTDPETGTLPPSAFTWRVDLHHDTHTHPFVPDTTGVTSGSFVIPNRGETSSNVWYRIHLTVRDSAGLTNEVIRDVLPTKVDVTLATSPAGLQVKLDGQPVTTPVTFTGVVGIIRELSVVTPQSSGGNNYVFGSWSDGGAATHEITTPAANTTYTASYDVSMTGLPAPWQTLTIGSVNPAGDATYTGGVFTVSAAGADIWNAADAFRFVYQPWSGDVDLRARVTSLTNTNAWAKSGVMIREDTTAGSKNVYMLVSAASGLSFQQRPVANASTTSTKVAGAIPKWLRVTRVGSLMTGYWSDNGTTWTQVASATVSMSASILVGLAVTSHNATTATQSNLDNVQVIGTQTGTPPTVATPASASPSPAPGTTTALSVLGADDQGEAALTYTWSTTGSPPAAVSFSANGTNAAKNSTATFTKAGTYNLQVVIRDAGGLTATSTTSVVVSQTLTSVALAPASATVAPMGTQQFTATARDQFGTALTSQPSFAWSVSGGGSISSGGLFTAGGSAGGPFTVTATGGGQSGTAQVTVSSMSPTTITLTPVADAHVRDGTSATVNFGTATALELKNSTAAGNNRRAFLRFSLTGIGNNVTNAKLRLFGLSVSTAKAVSVYDVADIGWSETGITWNTAPAIGAQQAGGVTVPITTATYVEWDLTAYIQAKKTAGATAVTVEVKQDVPNNETPTSVNSKENASNKPQLVVTGS
jgi:glucose/arabinose dehydrogenase